MNIIQRADAFAARKHASQVRKYSGDPYVIHPREVAETIRSIGGTDIHIAVALLHDTVEDTDATFDEIYAEFAEDFGTVAALLIERGVILLTDVDKSAGNRAERKAIDRERIAKAPRWVKDIKLADLLSNTADITANDPAFAVNYLAEKLSLLDVLEDGNRTLLEAARKVLWESIDGLQDRVHAASEAKKAERAAAHEARVVEARRLRWEKAEKELAENA